MFGKLNLKSFWYTNLFSLITLAVGIVLTAKPNIVETVCKLFGSLMIIIGIILLVLYFIPKKRAKEILSYGSSFLIAGILLAIIPTVLNFLIPVLFGGWILISSLSGIYRNFCFRNTLPHWWVGFILCIISTGLSIYILTRPITIMEQTIKIIGIVFIIHAVLRILSTVLGRNGYKSGEKDFVDTTIQEK
ncbi:MAG: DUF308 domain-containing protein [Oscillospiraceae bacterium]|nr:DUF308 domain-containing protein [Oscillospiraceae bacterium]